MQVNTYVQYAAKFELKQQISFSFPLCGTLCPHVRARCMSAGNAPQTKTTANVNAFARYDGDNGDGDNSDGGSNSSKGFFCGSLLSCVCVTFNGFEHTCRVSVCSLLSMHKDLT